MLKPRIVALLFLFGVTLLHPPDLVAQWARPKNVLVFYSHEREMATYVALDRALRAALEPSAHTIEFYTEYLDLMRFPNERRQQTLVNYLRVKYSDRNIDLIVVVSPLGLNFLLRYGDELFPGTPIVFTSVNVRTVEKLALKPNVTGIAIKREFRDTLDLALRLQPDTQRVVIPVGTSPIEKSWAAELRTSLKPYGERLTLTFLTDLPMSDMLREVKSLPAHTIVLFSPLFFYDGAKHYFVPEEALDLISKASGAPVYGTDEIYLGHGIVGGHLYQMEQVGLPAGEVAKRILDGESPAAIPVQTLDPNQNIFDARQLERWGISQSRLPPGSIVRFQQPSVWRLYKWYILACLVLFGLQSLLVINFILHARKLKQSESRLQELSRHLITAQEEERRRIARELHDDFGQRLAILRIELDILTHQKQSQKRSVEQATLRKLLSSVDDLSADMHHLSHGLHSSQLQFLGLSAALKELCGQVSKQHRIAVELQADDAIKPVPAEIALCFYRVAQEALHNTAKHSGASEVLVTLSDHNAFLRMRITDAGKGFNPADAAGGLGLASMRERLQMVGGQLRVKSKPGAGTELTAQAPVELSIN